MTVVHRARTYSFIIPSYNDAVGLQRHFEYFSKRSEHVELVIVDDHSTDGTRELVRNTTFPANVRVNYIRQSKNRGPAAARNRGIAAATGDYVMLIDADDILADCFFTYIRLSPLENGADVVVFKYHCSTTIDDRYTYRMHDPDNAFFSSLNNSGFPNGMFQLEELPSVLSIINFPWNKIYRREYLQSSGIAFPEMRMNEDILPHWHSFMRARSFGVMAWAPPLITHFEAEGGSRATNYVGPDRLPVFDCLRELRAEVVGHASGRVLTAEFERFTGDFFRWMTDVLCQQPDPKIQEWGDHYRSEIKRFNREFERT